MISSSVYSEALMTSIFETRNAKLITRITTKKKQNEDHRPMPRAAALYFIVLTEFHFRCHVLLLCVVLLYAFSRQTDAPSERSVSSSDS